MTVVLRTGDEATHWADSLQHQWRRWDCGVPLKVLHTDYASVVDPIVTFIDRVIADHPHDQIVVLIPVIRPDKFRYRILHNQLDLVLSAALRTRDDVIVARVSVPLEPPAGDETPDAKAKTTPAPVTDPSTPGPVTDPSPPGPATDPSPPGPVIDPSTPRPASR